MFGVASSSLGTTGDVLNACLGNIHAATWDLARHLGMEEASELHQKAHKRLASELEELAAMDAKMELKVEATMKARQTLSQEMARRRTSGSAAAAAAEEEVSMEHLLQRMSASVSNSMEGADEKVLQSKRYKKHMKLVTTIQGDDDDDMIIDRGNNVSLNCPLTSTIFKEPVQSKVCKHTFEKEAILHHIKIAGRVPAACPVAGCAEKVRSIDLAPDTAMMRLLRIESQTEKTDPIIDAEEIDDTVGETYI